MDFLALDFRMANDLVDKGFVNLNAGALACDSHLNGLSQLVTCKVCGIRHILLRADLIVGVGAGAS